MSPTASTSALYSRIARKYHNNETRDLRGLRLPKAKPKKSVSASHVAKESPFNYGAYPKSWSNHDSLTQMGLWKTASRDPLGIRLFLMNGADVVLCTGVFPETRLARTVFNQLIDHYLASMTLYSLPRAFYDEATT